MSVTLHWQIREWLRRQIDSGTWRPGDLVPTEQELAARFGVSRAPIRQALAALVQEGLVRRQPGRGTFVARPKIGQALDTLRGLAEELRLQGLDPAIEVLDAGLARPSPEVRRKLQVGATALLPRIDRLVRVDGYPLLWDRSFLAPEVALPADPAGEPLFAIVEASGFRIEEAEQTIEAAGARGEAAARLGIRTGAPVLLVRRLTRARRARPVIFTEAVYRGDRYRYRVALQRRPGSAG